MKILLKHLSIKDISLEEYELVERRDRTPRETEITYRLVYKNLENGKVAPSKAVKIETQ